MGRLQQRAWIAEAGTARSRVEVLAEVGAESSLGDDDGQGDAKHASVQFHSVVSVLVRFVVRSFSTMLQFATAMPQREPRG